MLNLVRWIGGLVLLSFIWVGSVHAQATRTWVSGVGDDANPCSRTAPCKTFAGAISKTAAGGEIDALDPGGFGALTITKAITIDGEGTFASILVAGTNGINVAAGAADEVILRGLEIQGVGQGLYGVTFSSGSRLHIEKCTISRFTNSGIFFEAPAASKLLVTGTTIESNNGNAVDVATGGQATVEGSVLSNNAGAGIFMNSAKAVAVISRDTIVFNGQGLAFGNSGGSIVSFGDNEITENTVDGAPTQTVSLK
jgi:hypothetical protein